MRGGNYTIETMSKHEKSKEIKKTDGRRYNKRLPSKVKLNGNVTSVPAKMNEAKKKMLPKIAEKVVITHLGGVEGLFKKLLDIMDEGDSDAVKLNAIRTYLEHLERGEKNVNPDAGKRIAPVINFITTESPQVEEGFIDVESEDVEDE